MIKQFSLSILIVSLSILGYGQQSGKITYQEKNKLEVEVDVPGGMDLSDMLPDSYSANSELIFSGGEMIYQSKSDGSENMDLNSDDGSIQIKIVTNDGEDILYTNTALGEYSHMQDFMGKAFTIEGKTEKKPWKISNEKIKYLGYECTKASYVNDEDELVVAWFTMQIPTTVGPSRYFGLPGAVLMVTVADGKQEIKATEVDLKYADFSLVKQPKGGKKVTEEEFDKIIDEKMKEMEEEYGNDENSFQFSR